MPRLYETTIVVSVLAEGEPYIFNGFEELAHVVTEGACSGHIVLETTAELTKESFVERCAEHGSDPEFFFQEEEDVSR